MLRSALRSIPISVVLAFLASLTVSFALLSHAAHGEALQAQPALLIAPESAPPEVLALASPSPQLAPPAMPASLRMIVLAAEAAPLPEVAAPAAPAADAPTVPPAADIPDPEQNPGGFIDAALVFWRAGGKVPIVLVGLIGLLSVLKRRVEWLRVGWRVTAVGVVGVLVATLLDTWFSSGAAGNIWSWLFGGIVGVVNFLSNTRAPAKAAA